MNEFDPLSRISTLADIEMSMHGNRVVVGAGSTVDSFVKMKFTGGSGDIVIGPNCTINSGTVIYSGNGVVLGDGVAVAANCTFAPTNHEYQRRDVPIREQGYRPDKGGIIVGDDVWIGAGTVLLDGASVGEGCVVAAGSVVRGHLESYGVYGGNPIKRLGTRG